MFGSVQNAVRMMMDAFFREGPTGGHYVNMMNASSTQVGCGVVRRNGELTIVQDFR